jgi:subtilisin family serine protease
MRRSAILAVPLLMALVGGGQAETVTAQQGQQRGNAERAYFRVLNDRGRSDVAAAVRHTFPNDVVSVEASPQAIANLRRNPNLQFRGPVSVWEPQGRPVGRPGGGAATCSPSTDVTDNGGRGWDVRLCNAGEDNAGTGRVVAVLDTGVNTKHPDFRPVVAGTKFVACKDATGRGVADGCADRSGHGTHVAGTVAANGKIRGVAPAAQLMAIKVCGTWCWGDDVARAIRWAADNKADIISMSLSGGGLSEDERLAIDHATVRDVLVVAAAGNSGPNLGSIGYPAGRGSAALRGGL